MQAIWPMFDYSARHLALPRRETTLGAFDRSAVRPSLQAEVDGEIQSIGGSTMTTGNDLEALRQHL
jgi:hypothetical protein